jgi:hypothetical protein
MTTEIAVRMNGRVVGVSLDSEAVTIEQFLKAVEVVCKLLGYRKKTIAKAFNKNEEGVTNGIQRVKQTNRCPA